MASCPVSGTRPIQAFIIAPRNNDGSVKSPFAELRFNPLTLTLAPWGRGQGEGGVRGQMETVYVPGNNNKERKVNLA
jgi:hypothetical protein